jgi:hypothetical protein
MHSTRETVKTVETGKGDRILEKMVCEQSKTLTYNSGEIESRSTFTELRVVGDRSKCRCCNVENMDDGQIRENGEARARYQFELS